MEGLRAGPNRLFRIFFIRTRANYKDLNHPDVLWFGNDFLRFLQYESDDSPMDIPWSLSLGFGGPIRLGLVAVLSSLRFASPELGGLDSFAVGGGSYPAGPCR
jgi:hypothetical protein